MAADWFESEIPLHRRFYLELDRLRRRAKPRWWLVVLIAVVLTALVVRKATSKPRMYRARVILAVSEGDVSSGRNPAPLGELRQYISSVLLTNERLLKLIDDKQLWAARRAKFGDQFVLEDLRDMLDIVVWRNYFQNVYESDDLRTARVSVAVTSKDPAFSYDMARAVASIVQSAEADRRSMAAFQLAQQASDISDAARARLDAVAADQREIAVAIKRAEAAGDRAEASFLQIRLAEVSADWIDATATFNSIEAVVSRESWDAAVTAAGLALEIEIVDERRPPPLDEGGLSTAIAVAIVGLGLFLPLAGVLIGAFDSRVHESDDVTRLGLPVLGHIPSFPGDHVGALRDRGVSGHRGASLRRWLRTRLRPPRPRAKSSTRSSSSSSGPAATGG